MGQGKVVLLFSFGSMVLFSVLLALVMIMPLDAAYALGTVNKIQSGLITSDSMTSGDTSGWTFGGSATINDYYEDSQGLTMGIRAWVGYYAYRYQPDAYLFHSTVKIHDAVVSNGVSNVGLYVEGSDFIPHLGCEAYADWSGHYWVVEQSSDAGETYDIIYITQPNEFPQTQDCTIITNGDNYLKVYIGGNLVFESNTMSLGMSAPLIAYFQDDTSSSSSMHYATYSNYYSTSDENIFVTGNPGNATRVKIVDSSNNVLANSPVISGTATLNVGMYNFPLSATINVYDSSNSVMASSAASIYGGDIYSVDVPLQTVPQPPTNLAASATSPSQINLSWTAPTNNGGSPITGYKIERSVNGGAFSVLVSNTGSTGTTYSNTGLTHSTTYSYRVSAINAIGTSSASNISSSTTFDVIPSPPIGLAATVISSSQIDLSWSAPSDNGGSPITGYKIERSANGGSTWNIIASNTDNANTAYSNTGLAPNTAYTYRVSAITSVGTSSPSNLASGTTPPQPPKIITLTASGLVTSDPLNNETKSRQELEAEQGFWHYGGSAFSYFNPPAPTDLYKDSE
ncbi:MAG: fibronectin type III domain-containing protein [Thaumarchaeota archaeon]|nr:fibronectin type III domain-containing protein [Nitrososphaerota archaeon]